MIGQESFAASEPRPRKARWRSATVALVSLLLITAGAGLGYVAGRGTLAVPAWVPVRVASMLAPSADRQDAPPALGGYLFEILTPEVKRGDGTIRVRLLARDGRPVPDAVIFARRLDMAPDGMATMITSVEPVPISEPGTYAFKGDLSMEGNWRLSLAAKVQGETGTAQGRLVFQAVE